MAKLLDLTVYGAAQISNDLSVNANVYAKAFITAGGTNAQVVRGDGTLASIADLSVKYAASAGNADKLDNLDSTFFAYNVGGSNHQDCNAPTYGTHAATYRFGESPTNAFTGSAWSNMLVIGAGSDTMTQIGAPYNADALYFRRGTWTSTGGSIRTNEWKAILHSANYTDYVYSKTQADNRYVNITGDTMTGLLTTTSGGSHNGVKVGDTYVNAINGQLIFQNNSSIRFGGDSWDYNVWAGLKYDHSNKIVYLGLADGTIFTANNAQSGGKLYLPGISNLYTGNGANLVWHAGNDGSGSGLDADLLDGQNSSRFVWVYNSANFRTSTSVTATNMAADASSNANVGMIYASTDNPTGSSKWVHIWSQSWTIGVSSSWVSQIATGVQDGTGMWYRTTSGNISGRAWTRVIDSSNIGSQSVNYANSAGWTTKLRRRDDTSDYSLQHHWTGTYWYLRGYNSSNSFHAEVQVGYALDSDKVDGLHVHSGRNNEADKVVRTDVNGYIQAGWINTTSGAFTGTPDRVYASNDAYIRYMTPANFFKDLSNNGTAISMTVAGQKRDLTVNYASYAGYTKTLENAGLPSSTSNAGNTVWCKFATLTFNASAWCNASGYFIFSGGEATDYRGILSYHFRASSTATAISQAELSWLTKSSPNATVIAVKTADNIYDLYVNNLSTWCTPRIYHFSAFHDRFKWNVGSWTTTKPTAAYTSSDVGRVYYATNAGNADTVDNQHFSYSNDSNSPTYLWGTNSSGTNFLAARTSLSVGHASTVTINYSNDSNSTYQMLWGSGNSVYGTGGIYCNPYTDYLYAGSMQTSNWFRSTGNTGWYSETHGGGWYMTDSTWVRTYNNKGVLGKGFYHSDYGSATYLLRSDGGVSAFNWSGQGGQPTWIWGGNSQHSYYVYNPSNFSVNYANSAGTSGYATQSPAAANYGGTGTTTKIKIKINSTTSWMLSFVVTLYQGYKSSKVMISGYNYGTNYWYEPEAVLLGDSNGATSIPVYFGYDSAWNLWVGFDGGNYTGVSVTDVTNGYTQLSSLKDLFTISNVSSLSTLQKTVTAVNSVNYAVSAGTASAVTISYNNDSNATYQMLWGSGNYVYGTAGVYCNPSTDYLYAKSMNASDWFRSTGATGWYNSTYQGGICMTDTNYVTVYNSKRFRIDSTSDESLRLAGGISSYKSSGAILSTYHNSALHLDTIYNLGNGGLSIDAPDGSLYLAYRRGATYIGGSTRYIDRDGNIGSNTARWNNFFVKRMSICDTSTNMRSDYYNYGGLVAIDASSYKYTSSSSAPTAMTIETCKVDSSYSGWSHGIDVGAGQDFNRSDSSTATFRGIGVSAYATRGQCIYTWNGYGCGIYAGGEDFWGQDGVAYHASYGCLSGSKNDVALYVNGSASFKSIAGGISYATTSSFDMYVKGYNYIFGVDNASSAYTTTLPTDVAEGVLYIHIKRGTATRTWKVGSSSGHTISCCWSGGSRSCTSFTNTNQSLIFTFRSKVWYVLRLQ